MRPFSVQGWMGINPIQTNVGLIRKSLVFTITKAECLEH